MLMEPIQQIWIFLSNFAVMEPGIGIDAFDHRSHVVIIQNIMAVICFGSSAGKRVKLADGSMADLQQGT